MVEDMIRGGISDKLGNEYEALWVAIQLIDIYRGLSVSLRYEPIEGGGFEFELRFKNHTEWHQSKQKSTSGRWTIGELARRDVLGQFKKRLTADEAARCVFITDNDAAALGALAKKARQVESEKDFKRTLSDGNNGDFSTLKVTWKTDDSITYELLKRISVETVSTDSVKRNLVRLVDTHFFNDREDAINRLKNILEENMTREITRDKLLEAFSTKNLRIKDYAATTAAIDAIKEATRRYLNDVDERKPPITIEHSEPMQVVDDWYANDTSDILFITGGAGSGKSYFAASAIEKFISKEIEALAFRVDRHLGTRQLQQLGVAVIRIEDNPILVLVSSSKAAHPVLLVDQLDAVSESSGRRQSTRDLIFELIQSNRFSKKVKIILVCREWDLNNDSRFKALSEQNTTTKLGLPELRWLEDIEPALQSAGYQTSALRPKQKEILLNPASLSIFLRLSEPEKPFLDFTNAEQLIEQLIDQANREISAKGQTWSAWEVLGRIVDRMNVHQNLSVPSALLDEFLNARYLLQSLGLVYASGGTLQLAHESYFDFLFARTFVAKGHSIAEWLKSDQQTLFRRTQVRQILSYMRSQFAPTGEYLTQLRALFLDDEIRFLIKDAVARWLSGVENPTLEELEIALSISNEETVNRLTQYAIFGQHWFLLLVDHGLLAKWLNTPGHWRDAAKRRIQVGFQFEPRVAAGVLREFWKQNPEEVEFVYDCVSWVKLGEDVQPVVDLLLEVIAQLPEKRFELSEPMRTELVVWHHSGKEELGIQLLRGWYERWFQIHKVDEPFIGDGMNSGKAGYQVGEFVKKAPVEFLEAMSPLFAEGIKRSVTFSDGRGRHSADWLFSRSFREDARWSTLIKQSVAETAKIKPVAVKHFAERFDSDWGKPALHYQLYAIAHSPEECHSIFEGLIDHPELFDADEFERRFIPAALAAKACKPHLSEGEWLRFEARLRNHKPEHTLIARLIRRGKADGQSIADLRAGNRSLLHQLNRNGREQWAIVETIGREHFSESMSMELELLYRKFGHGFKVALQGGGGAVISPLPKEVVNKMTDANWLSAIDRYATDESREYREDHVLGGAVQLAGMLEHLTAENPERVFSLLKKIPTTAHKAYACAILDGLKKSELAPEKITDAIKTASKFSGDRFDTAFVYLVKAQPQTATDDWIFDRLVEIAVTGVAPNRNSVDEEGDVWGTIKSASIIGNDRGAWSSGAYANRRTAWEALESVAWKTEGRRAELLMIADKRSSDEDCLDVLPAIVRAVYGLIQHSRDKAFDIFEKIARRDIRIVPTLYAWHAYNWILWQEPVRFSFVMDQLVTSESEDLRTVGYYWQAQRAISSSTRDEKFEAEFDNNSLAARCAAKVANDVLFDKKYRHRACEWINSLITHADQEVVKAAYLIDWETLFAQSNDGAELLERFINSNAFEKKSERFLYHLNDNADRHPKIAMCAVQRILDLKESADEETRNQWRYNYHLDEIVMSAYEGCENEPETRHQALDLIDRFLASDHYQVDRLIANYDRI